MNDRGGVRTGSRPDTAEGTPDRGPVAGGPVARVLGRVPLTTAYVVLLTLMAWWLSGQSRAERARFIRHNSSNVHHMEVGKWWTLFSSGIVVDGVPAWVGITAVAAAVGLAEWRWGAARAGAVFVFGHLGATLLTEGAMWVMLVARIPGALSRARDVGISYGLVATLGCLFGLGSVPLRRYGLPGLALVLATAWALDQQLADAGHLIALGLGVLASRTRWLSERPRRSGRHPGTPACRTPAA